MHFCMTVVLHDSRSGLDWGLLQSFVAVMRAGSFSAAAEATGLTQPTIGRHIRALEAHVGETLFERRGNIITPSARAAALFEHAEAMETGVLAIERQLAGAQDTVEGTVRISVPELLGSHVVPDIIAALHLEHPGIAIELVATNETQDLSRREADIAVRFFRPTQPDLVMVRVGELRVGLFASPAYIDRFGAPRSAAEFQRHRLIGEDTGERILRAMHAMGLEARRSDFVFRTDSLVTQLAAVKAGVGIGSGLVLAFAGSGMVRLLPELIDLPFEAFVVAHGDLHRSRRVRIVHDALVSGLRAAFRSIGKGDADFQA
jgi:DNA-binding transcriptional LysR family regulator